MANTKNMTDFIFSAGFSDNDLLKYAKQGVIIPLEEYIDAYMPNLQAVLKNIRNIEPCVLIQMDTSGHFHGLNSLK